MHKDYPVQKWLCPPPCGHLQTDISVAQSVSSLLLFRFLWSFCLPPSQTFLLIWGHRATCFSLQRPEQIQRSSKPAEWRAGDQGEDSWNRPSGCESPSFLNIIQEAFNWLSNSLNLILMLLYDQHKQWNNQREDGYLCVVNLNACSHSDSKKLNLLLWPEEISSSVIWWFNSRTVSYRNILCWSQFWAISCCWLIIFI